MIGKLVISVILLGIASSNAKTPGQVLDAKFKEVQLNISLITTAAIVDLKQKYEQLEQDIKVFKIIHGACAPCLSLHGKSGYCDCRNLEPKQDCLEFYQDGVRVNGIYRIYADKFTSRYAFCDQASQGGGWTVFQRRQDGSENFYRGWSDYKIGFGKLESEFWFGNDNIHDLTKSSNCPKNSTLLINMVNKGEVTPLYAMYNSFTVGDKTEKYVMHLSGFSGNTTDRLSYHNNMKFSTFDQDNDYHSSNCAAICKGSWWYKDCYSSNLNGEYVTKTKWGNITWDHSASKKVQPTFVEMKVRRNI